MYKQRQLGAMHVEGLHAFVTRGQFDARPAFQRLDLTQHSIYYSGPIVWNSLPFAIRESETVNVFKKQLMNYLIQVYQGDETVD